MNPVQSRQPGMEFSWDDLIDHLTNWERMDFRGDPERDAHRLHKIEFVLEQVLENLRALQRTEP